jgi:hypothetical protein
MCSALRSLLINDLLCGLILRKAFGLGLEVKNL